MHKEFDVDVDIHATVRVYAESPEDAEDMVEAFIESPGSLTVHSFYPTSVAEVE